MARRPAWPEDTVFRRPVLDVESDSCEHCGATLHVCDCRFHRIHTLPGPWSCPVAWLTAPTAFARFAANPSAELLLGSCALRSARRPPDLRANCNAANLLRSHRRMALRSGATFDVTAMITGICIFQASYGSTTWSA